MATKVAKLGAFGSMHTAGIYSDMTVDGPEIGTLVVIVDRAKNLPNRRSMGKQDPYCAARLGKEAKKTETDKRGGQTPRWDQELRFTVHDSPDYHNLKVSVFNDDKKTELIGEAWVSLESVLNPGGGQSDTWHGLSCKGKYAGEIRMELTYYDSRPKTEKIPIEKKRESTRPEAQGAVVGGPRESAPVKRRPLPSDPTAASPSPAGTPDHRPLPASHTGPRSYPAPPRQQRPTEHTPTHRRHSQLPDQQYPSDRRRPVPEATAQNGAASSTHHTPQQQVPAQHSPNPQLNDDGFDMSYTAPKPYEVQPVESLPRNSGDSHHRVMSQNDLRSAQGHTHGQMDPNHSYSAPVVSCRSFEPEPHQQDPYQSSQQGAYSTSQHDPYQSQQQDTYQSLQQDPYNYPPEGYGIRPAPHHPDDYSHRHSSFQDPVYQVEPLRTNRNHDHGQVSPHAQDPYHAANDYVDAHSPYDQFASHGRPPSAMQPTVEDEDDVPPPPPVHRTTASTLPHHHQQSPPNYHEDAPAPLNLSRYREEPSRVTYDDPPQPYGTIDHSNPLSERRYTHPRTSPHPTSRPVSRDAMVPSPLRQETSIIPSSLVAGYDPSRVDIRRNTRSDNVEPAYESPPSYETPPRQRHLSEPDYRTPPQYDTPSRPHLLTQHQSTPLTESANYHPHSSPQEPRHTSPFQEPAPIIKPRAMSPGNTHSPADSRASRAPLRSMPTRKSVSPRPLPSSSDSGERRLSGVPFNPGSFDVLNPTLSRSTNANGTEDDRRNGIEVNDKGQVVTFSGRVIDASDHLPLDSWAPEPERKGPQKERPVRERAPLSGARDIEAAMQRERDRKERDRVRNAANATFSSTGSPSNALVKSSHYYESTSRGVGAITHPDYDTTPPGSGGRSRLRKQDKRPASSFMPSANSSPSNIPMPHTNVLRERENVGGYGSSPGYGAASSRHSIAAPPIPAKVSLDPSCIPSSEDMTALSLELQSIDIGPGSGRYRGTARRRYEAY